jgi:hypothetical protein
MNVPFRRVPVACAKQVADVDMSPPPDGARMRDIFAWIVNILAWIFTFFAWIFTLTAGFAIFMVVAILVLLPIEAAENRATYAVADRYAHGLAAAHAEPRKAEPVERAPDATIKGVAMFRSPPGYCDGVAFGAPYDRFVLGFGDHGAKDIDYAIWWHCYAYPSGKTTLQLSVWDYLAGAAGRQLAANALIAAIAAVVGYATRWIGSRDKRRSLRPWAKAVWFAAFMIIITIISLAEDFSDGLFYESPEYLKWFVFIAHNTIWLIYEPALYSLRNVPAFNSSSGGMYYTLVAFIFWSMTGWIVGRLIGFVRARLARA